MKPKKSRFGNGAPRPGRGAPGAVAVPREALALAAGWLAFCVFFAGASGAEDVGLIRERVHAALLAPGVNDARVAGLVASLQADGSWTAIDYEDVSRTGFRHAGHLDRLGEMSRAFRRRESRFFGDDRLREALLAALDFWLERDFIADNWWHNQIGTPSRLADIVLLLEPELSARQREQAAAIIGRANLSAYGARPGGDLVRIADIMGRRALFLGDRTLLRRAITALAGEVRVGTGRGMQPDFSFHHRRDGVISTLAYGYNYPSSFVPWAAWTAGTELAFPAQTIVLLTDYYLEGITRSLAFGIYRDPGALNRDITRKGAVRAVSGRVPGLLAPVAAYRRDELEALAAARSGGEKTARAFNCFFWRSEYMTHQREHYFASVRMHSSRNHNVESPYNGEGLTMHHLADGANFLTVTGSEYADIFPVYDWQKVPGTTVLQKPRLPSSGRIVSRGRRAFVGGVSDGLYGAAAFDFQSPHDPLAARKAWFFFDREYLCLGAGITSPAPHPVVTTAGQRLLGGEVTVGRGRDKLVPDPGVHRLEGVSWVFHDGTAHVFITPASIGLANRRQSGDWRDINRRYDSEKVAKDVFTLWLDHGVAPRGADYGYVVVPGLQSAGQAADYARSPAVEVLANTTVLQAARHPGRGLVQAVFYEPGRLEVVPGLVLEAGDPCLVLVAAAAGRLSRLAVADPTRTRETLRLEVTARLEGEGQRWQAAWDPERRVSTVTFHLPGGGRAGASVVMEAAGEFTASRQETP